MADFSAADLLASAKLRYGERTLRSKIRGAEGPTQDLSDDAADLELLKIARGVIGKVEVSLQGAGGWPIPGVWPAGTVDESDAPIGGTAYRELWPYDLKEKALALLWARCAQGEQMSLEEQRLLSSVEKYFDRLEEGGVALGIGGETDVGAPLVKTVRDRSGHSNLSGLEDRVTIADTLGGIGWDRSR